MSPAHAGSGRRAGLMAAAGGAFVVGAGIAAVLLATSSCACDEPPTTTSTTSGLPAPTSAPPESSVVTSGPGTLADLPLEGAVIAVDPGHNGGNYRHTAEINQQVDAGGFMKNCNTTGTASGDYTEALFNWEVSRLLADELRDLGADVVLTRQDNDGWGPCIDERGRAADEAGADLLLSIHADGSSEGHHGFHVIHPTLVDGYTDGIVEPSAGLAATVRDEMVAAGFELSNYIGIDGLIARGDMGTLNHARVPAVLVEAGNMHNSNDLELLRSAAGQRQLSAALGRAVVKFVSAEPRA